MIQCLLLARLILLAKVKTNLLANYNFIKKYNSEPQKLINLLSKGNSYICSNNIKSFILILLQEKIQQKEQFCEEDKTYFLDKLDHIFDEYY